MMEWLIPQIGIASLAVLAALTGYLIGSDWASAKRDRVRTVRIYMLYEEPYSWVRYSASVRFRGAITAERIEHWRQSAKRRMQAAKLPIISGIVELEE